MKRFLFPLHRVLLYRRSRSDFEKARLIALEAELSLIRHQLDALNQSFQKELRSVLPTPRARAELGRYRMVIEIQSLQLNLKISEKQSQIVKQKELYVKANQAAEVLTRLKDKQKHNWDQQFQKELDNLAMDSYLSRWKQ